MSRFVDIATANMYGYTERYVARREEHRLWSMATDTLYGSRPPNHAPHLKIPSAAMVDRVDAYYQLLEVALLLKYVGEHDKYRLSARRTQHALWRFGAADETIVDRIVTNPDFEVFAVDAIIASLRINPAVSGIRAAAYPIADRQNEGAGDYAAVAADHRPVAGLLSPRAPWMVDGYATAVSQYTDADAAVVSDMWTTSAALFCDGFVARVHARLVVAVFNLPGLVRVRADLQSHAHPPAVASPAFLRPPLFMGLPDKLYYTTEYEKTTLTRLLTKYALGLHLGFIAANWTTVLTAASSRTDMLDAADDTSPNRGRFPDAELEEIMKHFDELTTGSTPVALYQATISFALANGVISGSDVVDVLAHDSVYSHLPRERHHVRTAATTVLARHEFLHEQLWWHNFGFLQAHLVGIACFKQVDPRSGAPRVIRSACTAAGFSHARTPDGTAGAIDTVEMPQRISINIDVRRLQLQSNQTAARFMVWLSHDLGSPQQTSSPEDEAAAAPGASGEFTRRMRQSSAATTRIVGQTGAAATATAIIDLAPGTERIPLGLYDKVAVGIAMYVVHRDDDDAAEPMVKRHGVAFVLLRELLGAWVLQDGEGVKTHLWEGPVRSDFAIDPTTMRTSRPMEYLKTAAVVVSVPNCPGPADSMRPDAYRLRYPGASNALSAKVPRPVVPARQYEIEFNGYLMGLLKAYSGTGETAYHSLMLLRLPGTPAARFTALARPPPRHSLAFFEALLRRQLWREALTDAEFIRIHTMAYSATHRYRVLAHERFWWIVTMAMTFVNVCIYKTDTVNKRPVEIMEDITITQRGDCDDDAEPLVRFFLRLAKLPLSSWQPMRVVQTVLLHMRAHELVMTTATKSLVGVGTGGGTSGSGGTEQCATAVPGAADPVLHMTCLLTPAWRLPDVAPPPQLPSHILALEKPRIMEGTGVYGGWLRGLFHCMPDGSLPPLTVLDSIDRYRAARTELMQGTAFDAPAIAVSDAADTPYRAAEVHPFFGRCVSICGPDVPTPDHMLYFYSQASTDHHFPHFSVVMAGDAEAYQLRRGVDTGIDVAKHAVVAHYIEPSPFFTGEDLPLSHSLRARLSSMPPRSMALGNPPRTASNPAAAAAAAADPDAELLGFRACTVFMNTKAAVDPVGQLQDKIDAIARSRLDGRATAVDWSVSHLMEGAVSVELRVRFT